ncbi:MAG: hypothetical protein C0592_06630 [Marinilabiliales bacterium]|nr:MAG: hypothetical protein C0592_06630 [Marinilabiliales bacterium]
MRYFLIAMGLFLCMPLLNAQENNFGIKWSGFVRNDMMYNTRQVVSARAEGGFFLAPTAILENEDGDDLNAIPNINLVGFTTRLKGSITGPDAFGATTSGAIEADFFGTNGTTKFGLRLRHAFVKLDWGGSQLLTGQYWHPTFVTDCYPGTISFGAGVPFNPLARNPQIRYTKKLGENLSVFGAILAQGHFNSIAGDNAQPNSGIPELHIQFQFKNDKVAAGVGVNYLTLKPANTTILFGTDTTTVIAKENVSGLSAVAYFKVKTDPVTFKLWGQYGQLTDSKVMMGGFYPIIDSTITDFSKEFVRYNPITAISAWMDVHTNGKKTQFGLFAGYTSNMGVALGTDEMIAGSYVGRWGNVESMMRVAPRIKFISGNMSIGFEVEYSTANYAAPKFMDDGITPDVTNDPNGTGIDDNGVVTNFQTADNIKVLTSFTYKF